jgi:hypothetical protein
VLFVNEAGAALVWYDAMIWQVTLQACNQALMIPCFLGFADVLQVKSIMFLLPPALWPITLQVLDMAE